VLKTKSLKPTKNNNKDYLNMKYNYTYVLP